MNKHFLFFIFMFCMSSAMHVTAQSEYTVAYIEQYKKIATHEMKRTGIPASIILAQGILESNSGQSPLAKKSNNHFGIKCKLDWKGETTFQDDDSKQECFRAYPTAKASYLDHSDFLKSRPNYAALFQLDPVDDSAWAYGLKKAGYATAPDYPKKLLKIIVDYELSQYNFPELEAEDTNIDSLTENLKVVTSTDSSTKITSTVNQPESLPTAEQPIVKLSNVKGIETSNPNNSAPSAMNGIGSLPKDSAVQVLFTITKKKTINYPKDKFKINQVPVIWAKAGSSFLEIAQSHKLSLYKLFEFNDLTESDIVEKDALVFLAAKKRIGNKSVHISKQGETLYEISQNEAIQLSYLKSYNKNLTIPILKEGTIVLLFKPKESKKNNSFREVSLNIESNFLKNIFKKKNK